METATQMVEAMETGATPIITVTTMKMTIVEALLM